MDLNQSHLLIVSKKKIFRQTFYCGNAPVRTSDCCAVLTACLQTEPGEGGDQGRPPQNLAEPEAKPVPSKNPLAPHIFRSPTGPADDQDA